MTRNGKEVPEAPCSPANEGANADNPEVETTAEPPSAEDFAEMAPDMESDATVSEDGEPDPFELLATENADLKDRLLRAVAETENLRRRAEREKAEATLYAASNFARDILSVADNLTRALEAVPEDQRAEADETLKNLISGIELTGRELINVFERHGIRRIDAKGEKFDPNMHQAMFKVPNNDVQPGTVVQVVQTGYAIGERVLRPAMVGVAEAAPK